HREFVKVENEVKDKINKSLTINGQYTIDHFHKKLGKIMREHCGMARTAEGLTVAKAMIKELKKEFWADVKVIGTNDELNQSLERCHKVAVFTELAELTVDAAPHRNESCRGYSREGCQTE